jgi:hypothetical protein
MNLPAAQAADRFIGSFSLWIPRPFRAERIQGPAQAKRLLL